MLNRTEERLTFGWELFFFFSFLSVSFFLFSERKRNNEKKINFFKKTPARETQTLSGDCLFSIISSSLPLLRILLTKQKLIFFVTPEYL